MSASTSYSSIDYSLLFPASSSSGTAASLLGILYGSSGTAQASAAGTLAALQNAETNETKEVAATASRPAVARDIAAFQTALANAKTPQDLLANPTALKVLLTANGLGDEVDSPALAVKALTSDVNDSNSLVNQLSDTRWKTVAETYDFANQGLTVLQNSQTQATIANAYAEVQWRESLDATTPGLSNALTFRSEASTITSADQILGDSVLRDVVTTALGIPEQIAFQDLGAQEQAITSRLDISKLQDPHYVDTLTQEYLINKAQAASTTSSTATLDQLALKASGLTV